jgi:hypothetical protein
MWPGTAATKHMRFNTVTIVLDDSWKYNLTNDMRNIVSEDRTNDGAKNNPLVLLVGMM